MPGTLSTTIVVPCYDEARRLPVDRFRAAAARDPSLRFLFVDDGSRDATPQRLESLAREAPDRFGWHRLPRNAGKAEAVRQGMLRAFAAGPGCAGYWDADLSTPLEDVGALRAVLEERPQVMIVLGARVRLLGRSIDRRALRHYGGRVFATGASWVLGLPVYDTQCGAKLLRAAPETAALFAEPFCVNWSFDVELLARFVSARGAAGRTVLDAIYEYPLHAWQDVPGSRVRPWDLPRGLLELWRIRRRYPPSAGRGSRQARRSESA
jgi:glycosyltransferase involved in cell wall biosynthesis